MKLIKQGKGNRVECDCCKSLLEFEAAEVKAIPSNKLGTKVFIVCSKCGFEVVLAGLADSVKDAVCERYLK